MPIHNMTPQSFSAGKIKIGKKGEMAISKGGKHFALPEKINHFLITKNERGEDGNYIQDVKLMDFLKADGGGDVDASGNLVGIPVRLMYHDINRNFPHMLARFVNQKCACSGDGKQAFQELGEKTIDCPCEKLKTNECKYTGKLSVMIDGPTFCGRDYFGICHEFRTTGKASVSTLWGDLYRLDELTQGQSSLLPLQLVMGPFQTAHGISYRVGIVPRVGLNELIQITQDNASKRNEFITQMQKFESSQNAIEYKPFGDEVDQVEFCEEFHPGQEPEQSEVTNTMAKEETAFPECYHAKNPDGCDCEHFLSCRQFWKIEHPEDVSEIHRKAQETDAQTPAPLKPIEESEFKNLRKPGLSEFAFENGDRINASPYEVAVLFFEKWGRVMGSERCPDDICIGGNAQRYIAEEKKRLETSKTEAPTLGDESTTKEKLVAEQGEEPAGEKMPFGGRQEEITEIHRKAQETDAQTWRGAFAEKGIVIDDVHIFEIVRNPEKWNDYDAWKALVSKFHPDVDTVFCEYTCRNMKETAAFYKWYDTLEKIGVSKAGELDTVQAAEFVKMLGADIDI